MVKKKLPMWMVLGVFLLLMFLFPKTSILSPYQIEFGLLGVGIFAVGAFLNEEQLREWFFNMEEVLRARGLLDKYQFLGIGKQYSDLNGTEDVVEKIKRLEVRLEKLEKLVKSRGGNEK